MGTPEFAVPPLEAIINAGYTVAAVVTQPDRPKGRHGQLCPPPVKETALLHGIPVLQPEKIRDPDSVRALRAYRPDVIVVAAFGQILPEEVLSMAPYGCINIHASLLPAYRGAAPIQWALIRGEKESGVTTMRMNKGLDTGDIIQQVRVKLDPEETGGSLFDKLSAAGSGLIIETLRSLEEGTARFTPQPEISPTPYAAMLRREDGEIDWGESAVNIERRIRGLCPWPGAYTFLEDKQLKIWRASLWSGRTEEASEGSPEGSPQRPGTVLRGRDGAWLVRTGEGILELLEIQAAGKKRMEAAAFLRGKSVAAGSILGKQR